jgi:Ca-activated chloride channel family protein
VGEVDPQRIIDNVREQAPSGVQLFAFGVGDDVNTVLLDTISQENRGASAYVRPYEALDEIVSGFYQKISTPVLASLAVDFGQVRAEQIYPYPLPDLFAGSQLVAVGRYRNGGSTSITLRGLVNGEEKLLTFGDQVFRSTGGEPFIARLWATRKIGYLLNEIRLRGYNQELVDEIVRLSTIYGIATPYTSFFVPEPQVAGQPMPQARATGSPMPTMAPAPAAVVELSKQVEKLVESALSAAPAEAPAGAAAVADSQAREALRSADTAVGGTESGVRSALDKNFVYQQGLWVDTLYQSNLRKRELALGSDEYFALLGENPAWAPYFAVSPNLIVVLDGMAYVVTDSGAALTGSQAASPLPEIKPSAPDTPTAVPPEASEPVAAAPQASPGQKPVCTAPAFGIGMLFVPGAWAWRRTRRTR